MPIFGHFGPRPIQTKNWSYSNMVIWYINRKQIWCWLKIAIEPRVGNQPGSSFAHIWACPNSAHPHLWQKLNFLKNSHIIYRSMANLMLINNLNRTQGQKSTRFEFCPYLGMPIFGPPGPRPIQTKNWNCSNMVISYINRKQIWCWSKIAIEPRVGKQPGSSFAHIWACLNLDLPLLCGKFNVLKNGDITYQSNQKFL